MDHDQALEALQYLDPSCTRADWVRIGAAAKDAGLSFEDFDLWSSTASNYVKPDCKRTWNKLTSGGITAKTLFYMARERGWRPSQLSSSPAARPRSARRPEPQQPKQWQTLSPQGRGLWAACREIDGGIALDYLGARACRLPPPDGDLRWHPELKHPSGYTGPALVALVTDAVTREPISLHRTWIKADGTKADVDPARLTLGNHRIRNGVVRLWPDEAVTYGLTIAEGIETALSAAWNFAPVWSVLNAGNMAQFARLPGIETLTIIVDNDPAGWEASQRCADLWREVLTRRVHPDRADLNDELRELGALHAN